jgi:hypothetical protein
VLTPPGREAAASALHVTAGARARLWAVDLL